MYFLDTNSIIYFLQEYKELDPIFDRIAEGKAIPMISVITKIELLGFPDLGADEEKQIRELLDNFDVADLSDEIIEETIKIRKEHHLKIPDAIIAASCVVSKAILVTRDLEGFRRVRKLRILNPFAGDNKLR
jgi:predicted nucleic acid-binding protein